jgi:hypothetical protein
MGGDGRSAADALALVLLEAMPRYRRTGLTVLGPDLLSEYASLAAPHEDPA